MGGWTPFLCPGVGASLALGLGWPLSVLPGSRSIYVAFLLCAFIVARVSGGTKGFGVLVLGSAAGLYGVPAFSHRAVVDHSWEGWDISLYYAGGMASILLVDSRRRRSGNVTPVRIDRPHRSLESTLATELIPSRTFFEQSRDGIHILDVRGKLRGANRQFAKMLGYAHTEIKKLHVWDWDARWTREEILESLLQADAAGVLVETCFRRKDGSITDVEISANRVEWRGQRLLYCVARDITPRKKAEQALLESEERFRVLVEQAADGFFVLDERGTLVDVNHMACTMLGYSRRELLGMIAGQLTEGYDKEGIETLLARVDPDQPTTFRSGARRKDGTSFPAEVRLSRYAIKGQQLFLALVRDITERQAHEREMEWTNRLYATLSAVNRAIVGVKTRDELFREICRVTVEFSGFKLVWVGWHDPQTHAVIPIVSAGDETEYLDGLELCADDRPRGRTPVGVCFRTGKPCIVHNLADKSPVEFWRDRIVAHDTRTVAALPLRLGGAPWGVIVVYARETDAFQDREISLLQEIADSISFAMDHLEQEERRRQAEESLRQREAQYRAVIETSTDGFWMTDVEGHILEVNDALVRRMGYSREEFLALRISDFEARETPEETAAHILEIRHKGSDLFETVLRGKDGTIWPSEVNVAYWPGSGGRILAFQRDITGRKQAEELLRQRLDLQDQIAKIAEAVPGAIYTFYIRPDGSSCFPYASQAIEDLSGIPREVLAEDSTPCFANFHPEDLPRVRESIEALLRTPSAWHDEFRYRHPTKGERWIEGWSAPRLEPDSRVLFHGYLADVTERKRVEQALRDSQAKLHAIVETAVDAIITIDSEGGVLSFNPSAERVFGYAAAEVIGRNISILIPFPHSLHHDGHIAQYLSTQERRVIGVGQEIPALRQDGTVFPMEIGVSEIQVGGKRIFVGILRDITERKAAEEEIRTLNLNLGLIGARRTAELESMLANATIGLAFFDRQLRFLRVNHTLAEYKGIPVNEFLGRTLRELDAPSADQVEPILQKIFETGEAVPGLEHSVRRFAPPQEVREVLESYFPVVDAKGEVICAGTAMVDITDRKRAEVKLAELNGALMQEIAERERVERQMRLLADVLEASPDLVGIADSTGRVIHLNRAFKEALRRSPETGLLMIRDCHPPEAVRIIEAEGLPTAARLGVWSGETEFTTWDGRTIPMSKLIISHRDVLGRLQYYSTIMRDISERKRMEEALRRHGQELAVANAELARSARLKDEFLASMSHELRTPLNGILNISQGITEEVYGPVNPRQQEALRDVEECGRHLLSLINDILDVAKVEAGKIVVEPGSIPVEPFCQATLRLVKETAQKKRLRVSLELDKSVTDLSSDERLLKQILVNLLSNAVKFTPDGGEVTLEVAGDRAAGQVRFTVRDTGIGISRDDLPRLFQPFVQLDSRLSRLYPGTGLGLALVKRLTTLLGGQTMVESQPGTGSRFTVVLPWTDEGGVIDGEHPLAEKPGGQNDEDEFVVHALVVVVEDNPLNAKGLCDYLCFKGFHVECASNGADGVALTARLRPDLVVMDIQMPEMDGLEAIERIRRLPVAGDVPIIALTALAMPGDRERCLEAGATAYASKPVVLDQFLQLVSMFTAPALSSASR